MTLKTDIYSLIKPLVDVTLIWADQNTPRPALPYSAIKVMSERFVNYDFEAAPNGDGIAEILGDREFTLTVEYFGDSPVENLQMLVDKLRLPSTIEKFFVAKYTAFNTSQVADISALLDKLKYEPRATVDVFMRVKKRQSDNVGLIEKAIVTPVP